jgi:hypothetical protein
MLIGAISGLIAFIVDNNLKQMFSKQSTLHQLLTMLFFSIFWLPLIFISKK